MRGLRHVAKKKVVFCRNLNRDTCEIGYHSFDATFGLVHVCSIVLFVGTCDYRFLETVILRETTEKKYHLRPSYIKEFRLNYGKSAIIYSDVQL